MQMFVKLYNVPAYLWKQGKIQREEMIGQCWNKTTSCLTFIWLHNLSSNSVLPSYVKTEEKKNPQWKDLQSSTHASLSKNIDNIQQLPAAANEFNHSNYGLLPANGN